jgi:hypothetical protein
VTRRPKKPLPPPARVTPQTAFKNLLRKSQSQQPHALCRLLEEAILDNRVRAWRDGVLMSPQELRGYYVHIEQEADGRWACTIKPQGLHRIKARIVNVWETEDGRQMMTLGALPSACALLGAVATATEWAHHRGLRNAGGRRLALDHDESQRQHDVASRAHEFAYAALTVGNRNCTIIL